ncbi:hypothetical protein ACUXZZ_39345 [Streptomyces graminifolii]
MAVHDPARQVLVLAALTVTRPKLPSDPSRRLRYDACSPATRHGR